MKNKILIILALVFFVSHADANRLKVLKDMGKRIFSPKALGALGTLAGAKTIKDVLDNGEGAYVFSMNLNPEASALYWADVFSKPDIYVIIHIDGEGVYLLPEIRFNYSGEEIRWNIRIPKIEKGKTVLVQVYDDDSSSNEVWNGILSSNGRLMFDGGSIVDGFKFDLDFRNVNILNKKTTLDARDFICEFKFEAPSEDLFSDQWNIQGQIQNSKDKNIGMLGFAQLTTK